MVLMKNVETMEKEYSKVLINQSSPWPMLFKFSVAMRLPCLSLTRRFFNFHGYTEVEWELSIICSIPSVSLRYIPTLCGYYLWDIYGEAIELFLLYKSFISHHFTKNEVFNSGFFQYMWPNPQETADWGTFTEEILNRKLLFLCKANHEKVFSVWLCTFNSIYS